MSIPVIDLGAYMAGAPGALERVGDELGAALETIGFFLIVSHGIERELIARTFAEARRFHAQPAAAKLADRNVTVTRNVSGRLRNALLT